MIRKNPKGIKKTKKDILFQYFFLARSVSSYEKIEKIIPNSVPNIANSAVIIEII